MKIAFTLIRWMLGAIFIYAGVVKSSASAEFLVTLLPFFPDGSRLVGPVALILPWAEIAAGLMTIFTPRRIGAALILALCLVFISVLTWALSQGIIVACSCFGADEAPSAEKMLLAIARDIMLVLGAVAVLLEKPLLRYRERLRE